MFKYSMKVYSKIITKIRNNKARIKKSGGIGIMVLGLRYGTINPIHNNLSSSSTQHIKNVQALESTLQIRSGNIEGVGASTVYGFGLNPPISRPSRNKYLNSQIFGVKTSLNNGSPDSSDSQDDTCSCPDSSSEYLDQLLSETFDDVCSSSVNSSNNHPISEVPEVSLDY